MKLIIDPLLPHEAATVSGVALANQRNLRRSGYIPKNSGHARFTLEETAELLVFGSLSERGIGPKVSSTFAKTAARGIFLKTLHMAEIYTPEAAAAAHEVTKPEADTEIQYILKSGQLKSEVVETHRRWHHGALAKKHLAELIEAQVGARGEKTPDMFILFPNGHPEFFYDGKLPFEDVIYGHPAWQGPMIMFSMGGMAAQLASRLPRPMVRLAPDSAK